ncbi:hypothetical protein Tco_1118409 [Tanacetum coccineum]
MSENISLKKTVAKLQKVFSRMEAHCVNMELKYQNQSLKEEGPVVLETINIELEHSVAKLLAENEKLRKKNEHLKQIYKDLYAYIKKTRVQTKDHNDSLIAQTNITPHYLPKVRESVLAKLHHVIAPGSSRNNSKESYGSNYMARNDYLEESKKKTQDKNRNLKPRDMPFSRIHHSPNICTPKARSNNQTSRNWPASKSSEEMLKAMQKAYHSRNTSSFSDSKHFLCSTCQKCVFNANHDAYITKFLKEKIAAPRVVVLADSLVSTSIDQDASSTTIPSTQEQDHSPNISQGFKESPKSPTFRDDPHS